MKRLAILALAVATAFTSYVPAQAFPVVSVPQSQSADVLQVRDGKAIQRLNRRHFNRHNSGRHYRGNWRHGNRHYGRRHHNNAGAIIGGLAAGAIIGGVLSNGSRSSYSSHAEYCYSRYKSYRASDNTFQPYNGPRQQCR